MNDWSKMYQDKIKAAGGSEKYLTYKVKEKKLLLDKVVRYAGKKGTILEAGCGTGVLSTFLVNQGFKMVAIDLDPGMIRIARQTSQSFPVRPEFKKMDLFKLGFKPKTFDLVFSHGVLEHFPDDQIIFLLKRQLEIGKKVVFSVPSNYLTEKDCYHGDERFLSREKWRELISAARGRIIEEFGFHYILGWRKYWDCFVRRKFFGPHPYISFVVQK